MVSFTLKECKPLRVNDTPRGSVVIVILQLPAMSVIALLQLPAVKGFNLQGVS
jgi:hypothetical protein